MIKIDSMMCRSDLLEAAIIENESFDMGWLLLSECDLIEENEGAERGREVLWEIPRCSEVRALKCRVVPPIYKALQLLHSYL